MHVMDWEEEDVFMVQLLLDAGASISYKTPASFMIVMAEIW